MIAISITENKQKDDIISLNVGGIMYTATRKVLTTQPKVVYDIDYQSEDEYDGSPTFYPTRNQAEQRSKLQAMFGHPATKFCPLDGQGNFFIDRDGQLFRHVLNYLRTGGLLSPSNYDKLQSLQCEADYYQIPSLSLAVRKNCNPIGKNLLKAGIKFQH